MLNCHQVTRLMSQSQERPLSIGERLNLRLHTAMCSGCRNFGEHLRILRSAMRRFASGDARATDAGARTE